MTTQNFDCCCCPTTIRLGTEKKRQIYSQCPKKKLDPTYTIMIDNYSHDDIDIIYVTECIPGPSEESPDYDELLSSFNSLLMDHCACDRVCLKSFCRCLKISQGDNYDRYIYNGNLKYRLNYKSDLFSDYPLLECNSNCSCLPNCGNRVVQHGPMEGLVVKPCSNKDKGLGLFTPHCIHKGAFICEYAGELLTRSQALTRTKHNQMNGLMNYIFCLNEHTYAGLIQTFVDPSKFGNIGRYLNHSCEPNCVVVPVRIETAIPKLAIFACKDILSGDELTFNYGTGNETEVVPDGEGKKPCLCNTESCTGFLPFNNF